MKTTSSRDPNEIMAEIKKVNIYKELISMRKNNAVSNIFHQTIKSIVHVKIIVF